MTMSYDDLFLYLLLLSNAVVLILAVVAIIRFERRWQRIDSFWDSPTGVALSEASDEEMREQTRATLQLERRLSELQRAVKRMQSRAPDEPTPLERKLPIDNAVRMARSGASVEDLTRNCGLSVGEARLMKRLHGRAPSAASA